MPQLKMRVVSIDEENFPASIKFELVDVFGTTHMFSEKLPVIGIEIQEIPYTTWIECTVSDKRTSSVLVSTQDPYGVESENGNTEFEIPMTSFR